MTVKAREVLSDCRLAGQMLEKEKDLQRWRVHWAAAVALVRTVGHVLDKVDGRTPAIKIAAADRYKIWKSGAPKHEIFREFIEKERNNLLKEYQINIHPVEEVSVVVRTRFQRVADGELLDTAAVFELGENIYRAMLDGPWAGEDARDVLQEAIKWWETELDTIDKLSKRTPTEGVGQ